MNGIYNLAYVKLSLLLLICQHYRRDIIKGLLLHSTDSLRVLEMSSVVPYLNISDLKEILHKIGTTSDLSVAESRPFKTVQYLQVKYIYILLLPYIMCILHLSHHYI